MSEPLRPGDVWLVDLNPVVSSEKAGRRPAVVVSGPLHLSLPHAVVFVVPVTSRDRGLRHQMAITSQTSGLSKLPSFTRPSTPGPSPTSAWIAASAQLPRRSWPPCGGYSACSLTCRSGADQRRAQVPPYRGQRASHDHHVEDHDERRQ
jgi:PemK-like, MazF-like toxin of type II toxin-antitoxin system